MRGAFHLLRWGVLLYALASIATVVLELGAVAVGGISTTTADAIGLLLRAGLGFLLLYLARTWIRHGHRDA